MINNSRGLQPKYFTPEYLALVKFAVEECKKRGLKMWIEDEAGYPDGFAGGAISRDYPELGMQGIVADGRYSVAAGQTLKIPVPPDPLGVLAYNRSTRTSKALPIPASGLFQFTAPNPGLSEVVFVRHVYRSSPTRSTNREDGAAGWRASRCRVVVVAVPPVQVRPVVRRRLRSWRSRPSDCSGPSGCSRLE